MAQAGEDGQRQRLFGGKGTGLWTFWQRRPMDRQVERPAVPSANTGNTESKMVWLQALGVLLPS